MRLLRLSLAVLLVGATIYGCSCKIPGVLQKETITSEKAIEIGKKELEKRGGLLSDDNLIVTADNEDKAWKEITLFHPIILQEKIKKLHLEKKIYWVIAYTPKKPMLGGITVIFVDRTNGEMLDFYGGE